MTIKLKSFAVLVGSIGVAAMLVPGAWAAKKKAPTQVEGIVVRVEGSNLIVNAAEEKHFQRMTVASAPTTEVLIDGKMAKLSELEPGSRVIIAPPSGTAVHIEEKRPRRAKAADSGQMEGAVVTASASELIFRTPLASGEIADAKAAINEKSVAIIDGKASKAADLKPGQYVLVLFVGGDVRRIVVQPNPGE